MDRHISFQGNVVCLAAKHSSLMFESAFADTNITAQERIRALEALENSDSALHQVLVTSITDLIRYYGKNQFDEYYTPELLCSPSISILTRHPVLQSALDRHTKSQY